MTSAPSTTSPAVNLVGIGESLFDCFPDRQVLGGAPLNAVVAMHQLGRRWPVNVRMVSRVGRDELGDRIRAELKQRGLSDHYLQSDTQRPTGTVQVTMRDGQPDYTISPESAWDALCWSEELAELASVCQGVIFGTLAQRSSLSRETIVRFVTEARSAVRLLDVNLRQRFYSRELLESSLALANVVKLNDEELRVLAELFGWEEKHAALQLLATYGLKALIVTHGEHGTELVLPSGRTTAPVPTFPPAENADPVGAGDACAATCLLGFVDNWPNEVMIARANRFAAYVASQGGATPVWPESLFEDN